MEFMRDIRHNSEFPFKVIYYIDVVETEYGDFFKYTLHIDDDTVIEAYARSQNRGRAILFQKLSEHYLERAKNV
jgi:hypothetical protein